MSTEAHTFEEIVDGVLAIMRRAGALPAPGRPTPWDDFVQLSELVHDTYRIPSTTFTPIMRRFLYSLGLAARPRTIVGIGTYVGYTFSWLLRDRSKPETAPFFERATGIDVDASANALARSNCQLLGHGEHLRFLDADGISAVSRLQDPIDLLYLDLDDPRTRKAGYLDALRAATPLLASGALVLAHDVCVPRFADDFEAYHHHIRTSPRFVNYWVLPFDQCGISVAVAS